MELDLVDESRGKAAERLKLYKQCMCQAYNKKVMPHSFQVGDAVWKKSQSAREVGKLQPCWEGPYRVIEKLTSGAYYLEDEKGKRLKHPWNAFHL